MLFLLTANVWAQSSGFNYKALITNNGIALATQTVDVKFSLLDGTSTAVYEETHATSTNANGIVSVLLGEGTVVSGDFSTIDWTNNYSLKVEIDTQDGNGYQDFGTNPFKYVPYAKYAEKAGNVFSGDYGDLTNVPADLADGDDDTQLTEAEVDVMVENNGYLTSEIDGDVTNELQTVTFDNDSRLLTISNGNSVTIPASSATSGDGWGTQVVETGVGLIGDGTNITPLSVNPTDAIFDGWDKDVTDDVTELNDLSDAKTIGSSVFVGTESGMSDSGVKNTGVGYKVLDSITTGGSNVAMGWEAQYSNKTGFDNVGIGDRALYKNNQSGNTALGFNALYFNTGGYRNVAIGRNAGRNNQGSRNIFLGYHSGYNETGSDKLYIDNSSTSTPLIYGDFNTNALTINGSLAIKDGAQGLGKVFTSDADGKGSWEMLALQVRNDTLDVNGSQVVFAGWDVDASDDVQELNDLSDATVTGASIYLGQDSGVNNTGLYNNNVGVGPRVLQNSTSAEKNVAIGFEAMNSSLSGIRNVAIGDRAIYQNLKDNNTAVGFNALYSNINGSNNVALGYGAGRENVGSNNVFIGYNAGHNEVGDNKLYIDNSDTDNPLIYGDFSDDYIKINGELHGQDSGDADMKAYIYGNVTSTGSIGTSTASSDGFTVTSPSEGVYHITFVNSPGVAGNYMVIATMNYGYYGFITVQNHDTYFEVKTYKTNGIAGNKNFNFVVYKK